MDAEWQERIERLERLLPYQTAALLPAVMESYAVHGNTAAANTAGGGVAVAAATITQVAGPIVLTPGRWMIYAWANVLMGAGAGTADVYIRQGTSAVGHPSTWTLAAAAQGGGAVPLVIVTLGVTTSYNLACYSSAACTVRETGGAGGFGAVSGIAALQLSTVLTP